MMYCIELGDWFTLCGAIASTVAIIVALRIASSQERKNQKRIEEENKNIGETICALIKEVNNLSTTLVTKGYRTCINQLEQDDVSVPVMKLVPMTGIKKLGQFSPDILYRVFKNFKLTGEDYRNFVLSIDDISSNMEVVEENHTGAVEGAVNFINKFQEKFQEFNMMVYSLLQVYEKEKKTSDPTYTGIVNILETFNVSEESRDYSNIRYKKDELIDKIRNLVEDRIHDSRDLMNIFITALNLESIFLTLQASNGAYVESLKDAQTSINEDIVTIMQIHDKLEKQCK